MCVDVGNHVLVVVEVDDHAEREAAQDAFSRRPPAFFAFLDVNEFRDVRHAPFGQAGAVKYPLPEVKVAPSDAGGAPAEGSDLQEGFSPRVGSDLDVAGDCMLMLAGGRRGRLRILKERGSGSDERVIAPGIRRCLAANYVGPPGECGPGSLDLLAGSNGTFQSGAETVQVSSAAGAPASPQLR